jgi:hypothetical protein
VQHFGKTCTREIEAELLLQSWSELSDSAVAAGRDFSEEISDDEDSKSSDEDFELRMTTDTDNEDIAMMQADILEGEEAVHYPT